MNRKKRASIAQETLDIIEQGWYENASGQRIEVRDDVNAAVEGTVLYAPDDFNEVYRLRNRLLNDRPPRESETRFDIINATTLATARELVEIDANDPVVCLNFASAKNPGGGFLGGSQAQEESLARASALYPCINPQRQYYETNRRNSNNGIYTDHMIYSPNVPVFRDDEDELLDDYYRVAMITAPAVNAGAAMKKRVRRDVIEPTMRRRIQHVLSIAVAHNHTRLVLGAWGCGVFRNDPVAMAEWFVDELKHNPRLVNAFDHVVFAVLDRGNWGRLEAFENAFAV